MRKTPVAGGNDTGRPADLRQEEAGGDAGHRHICGESHGNSARSRGRYNPGILELCHSIGKVIGVLPNDAEIVAVVGVLPDVLAGEHQVLSRMLAAARRGIRCDSPE